MLDFFSVYEVRLYSGFINTLTFFDILFNLPKHLETYQKKGKQSFLNYENDL